MILLYTIAAFLGYIIGSLPLSMLTYSLIEAERTGGRIKLSKTNLPPLAIYRIGDKKTALLCTLIETMKVPFSYTVILMITHNIYAAITCGFLSAIGATFPFISRRFTAYKSILPLLSFTLTLHPLSGCFMMLFHIILLRVIQKPLRVMCYTSILTPFIFCFSHSNIAYTLLVLALSCLNTFLCRAQLLGNAPSSQEEKIRF